MRRCAISKYCVNILIKTSTFRYCGGSKRSFQKTRLLLHQQQWQQQNQQQQQQASRKRGQHQGDLQVTTNMFWIDIFKQLLTKSHLNNINIAGSGSSKCGKAGRIHRRSAIGGAVAFLALARERNTSFASFKSQLGLDLDCLNESEVADQESDESTTIITSTALSRTTARTAHKG